MADDLACGLSTAEVARRHGLSRRTVQRVPHRTGRGGRVRLPRRPGPLVGTVGSATPPQMVELLCGFRQTYPAKGHHFCYHLLRRRGERPPAPVTIWRIWRRWGLLTKRRRRQQRRQWTDLCHGPGFFQMDTTYVSGGGFVFAAVETQSRWAHAAWAEARDSQSAARFLRHLEQHYPGQLRGVQTDNGSEFGGAFKSACRQLGLPHYLAWVRCPDQNGKVERFIGTLRSESLLGCDDPTLCRHRLRENLARCLREYNHDRPHCALGWRTPMECLILKTDQSHTPPPWRH